MIRLRRSFASLLMGVVALLSLVLRTGDRCATLPAEAVGAVAHHHEAAQHEDTSAGERAHDERHDATAPKHCATTAACATIALATTLTTEEPALLERAVIAVSDDTVPASARGAPEPPPPRA